MSIEVRCGTCAKRFAAPDRWAGRQVQCPACGGAIEVPAPTVAVEPLEPLPRDPLAGLSEDELTAGRPLGSVGPRPPARPPQAPGMRPPIGPRPLQGKPPAGNSGLNFPQLLFQHKLFCAVVVVTGIGLIASVVNGHLILAGLYVVFGGGMALIGLLSLLANRDRASSGQSESSGQLGAWLGGLFVLMIIIWQILAATTQAADGVERAFQLRIAIVLIVLVTGLLSLILVIVDVVQGRSFFRALACGYLVMFGALPVVVLLTLPEGSGDQIGGRAAERKAEDLASIPLPGFPERGPTRTLEPGVQFTEVRLDVPPGQPGAQSRLYIYLPPGTHAPRSLPCVLIAPAGTILLHGMELGEADRREHTPYVKAGFAVVAYELDGPVDDLENATFIQVARAFEKYSAALGGLVNARNALEFVHQRMPEVDPERIYAAGHSSAGTIALVFAAHEPRIKGCVAYAPAIDLVERMKPAAGQLRLFVPGALEFLAEWSPRTHEAKLGCPLFLFHARDDSNVPFQDSAEFCDRLRRLGKDVTFETVDFGDHYDSMIREGIPRAIAWLLARSGQGDLPKPTAVAPEPDADPPSTNPSEASPFGDTSSKPDRPESPPPSLGPDHPTGPAGSRWPSPMPRAPSMEHNSDLPPHAQRMIEEVKSRREEHRQRMEQMRRSREENAHRTPFMVTPRPPAP